MPIARESYYGAVNNKELTIVPGANHCELYDGGERDYIPFDRVQAFFEQSLRRRDCCDPVAR